MKGLQNLLIMKIWLQAFWAGTFCGTAPRTVVQHVGIGGGTMGWVMLDNVPIWFELWRQLNGFPPSLYQEPQEEKAPKDNEKSKESSAETQSS